MNCPRRYKPVRVVIAVIACARCRRCRNRQCLDKDKNVLKARVNKNWYWLLVLPYLAVLCVPSYNRIEPVAFGIPFFYWYQLLWVMLSTLVIAFVLYFSHMRKR